MAPDAIFIYHILGTLWHVLGKSPKIEIDFRIQKIWIVADNMKMTGMIDWIVIYSIQSLQRVFCTAKLPVPICTDFSVTVGSRF